MSNEQKELAEQISTSVRAINGLISLARKKNLIVEVETYHQEVVGDRTGYLFAVRVCLPIAETGMMR